MPRATRGESVNASGVGDRTCRSKASFHARGNGLDRLQRLKSQLEQRPHVKVGLLGKNDNRPDGELGNVEIGAVHEFGAPAEGIPKRSFLRATADEQRQNWGNLGQTLARGLVNGKITVDKALGVLGERAVADIRLKVTDGAGIPPPNAPETVERKGSDRPLIDTGRMLQSLSYERVKGGTS